MPGAVDLLSPRVKIFLTLNNDILKDSDYIFAKSLSIKLLQCACLPTDHERQSQGFLAGTMYFVDPLKIFTTWIGKNQLL